MARALIEAGAAPGGVGDEDETLPLLAAAAADRREALLLLLDSGADPLGVDAILGHTALHRAVDKGHQDLATLHDQH